MAITSSQIISDSPQIDGRRSITERHLDQFGEEYLVHYLCDAGFNVPAAMAARASSLYADKERSETDGNVKAILDQGSLATVVSRYTTASDTALAIRERYKTATRTEAITLSSPQPAMKGVIYVTPKVGKASGIYYIDPKIVLS